MAKFLETEGFFQSIKAINKCWYSIGTIYSEVILSVSQGNMQFRVQTALTTKIENE